jgi:hypothetical protein
MVLLRTKTSTQHNVAAYYDFLLKRINTICWQKIQTSSVKWNQKMEEYAPVITFPMSGNQQPAAS